MQLLLVSLLWLKNKTKFLRKRRKTNAWRLLAALFPFLTHCKLPLKLVLVFSETFTVVLGSVSFGFVSNDYRQQTGEQHGFAFERVLHGRWTKAAEIIRNRLTYSITHHRKMHRYIQQEILFDKDHFGTVVTQ